VTRRARTVSKRSRASALAIAEHVTEETALDDEPSVNVLGGGAWSEVAVIGPQLYRIRLGGAFRPMWMGALCNALAEHKLSIEIVHAARARDWSWVAELRVQALPGAPNPRNLHYVELAHAEAPHAPPPLALSRYTLEESESHGGALLLTIEAPDTLGLLGALLATLASVELFPIELHIDTQAGVARDQLWLVSPGATQPSTSARSAVHELLRRAIR
jgi:hypothetical protein